MCAQLSQVLVLYKIVMQIYAWKVACSEDLKPDRGAAASFNQQTSENIGVEKNQSIVQDLDVKAIALAMYCIVYSVYVHLMGIKWSNCEKGHVSYILFKAGVVGQPYFETYLIIVTTATTGGSVKNFKWEEFFDN